LPMIEGYRSGKIATSGIVLGGGGEDHRATAEISGQMGRWRGGIMSRYPLQLGDLECPPP
jgi:hypothetical protein